MPLSKHFFMLFILHSFPLFLPPASLHHYSTHSFRPQLSGLYLLQMANILNNSRQDLISIPLQLIQRTTDLIKNEICTICTFFLILLIISFSVLYVEWDIQLTTLHRILVIVVFTIFIMSYSLFLLNA